MSKAQEIREALANGALSFEELHGKLGGDEKKLAGIVSYLVKEGELSSIGRGMQRSLALAGKRARGGAKPAKKVKRRKRAKAKRPYRRVAERLVSAPTPPNGNGALARQHVRTTLAALETLIDLDEVEPMVRAAFASHKEAIELLSSRG